MEARYSAGMIKHSLWFAEFRKVIQLIQDGHTLADIKTLSQNENIFAAPTQRRAVEIFNTVSKRVKNIPSSMIQVFVECDISTQKLIAIIAIMRTEALFFDFMYEVYREKLMMGSQELTDSDIRIFFKNKQLQSEKVAGWTENTLHRLGICFKTLLMEAGLTDRSSGAKTILKPIIDQRLEQCLKDEGMEIFIHALTGVK